jgi:hypothetical protein
MPATARRAVTGKKEAGPLRHAGCAGAVVAVERPSLSINRLLKNNSEYFDQLSRTENSESF